MTRSSRTRWSDVLIAGLLAVLTGREVVEEIRRRGAPHDALAGDASKDQFDRAAMSATGSTSPAGQGSQLLPRGVQLPRPSVWPMVLAGGLSLVLFGIVTSYAFVALGTLLILGALGGWIGDLLYAGTD
jgi:hypothetical protein